MISRAIQSARKHGINLKHGSPNPGVGDCAFEAVIQNNNDRQCFRQKFPLTIGWYRRIWVTDMSNRTVDSSWNTIGQQQWLEGWQEMLIPGTYERGIFGDLMLPGIACGVKKILLIFNTNLDAPHDPIYVVDPRQFDIQPDTEIPIVLAYNMSHYESMEPCTEADNQLTAVLVKDYSEGRYKYSKKDLPLFLEIKANEGQQSSGIEAKKMKIDSNQENSSGHKNRARKKQDKEMEAEEIRSRSKSNDSKIDLDEIDDFLDNNQTAKRSDVKDGGRENSRSHKGSMKHDKQEIGAEINLEEVDNFLDEDDDFVKNTAKEIKNSIFWQQNQTCRS